MHIDWWTLALQTVNVLVLIWILGRFFFRPVVDIVAKRQAEANKLLADAAAARQQAADARADADKARRRNQRRAGPTDRRGAKVGADGEGKSARASRRTKSRSCTARPKRRSRGTEAQPSRRSSTRASELAVEIAQRLLGRLPSESCSVRIPRWALSGAARTVVRGKRELCVGGGGRSCHRGRDGSAAFDRRRRGTSVMRSRRRSVRNSPFDVSQRSGLDCRHRASQPQHDCTQQLASGSRSNPQGIGP